MPDRSVTVRVPATSANLGPGFDSLGVALDWFGTITIRTSDSPQPPPEGPMQRMAAAAALALLDQAGETPRGLSATYEGDMPVGRGLGMSAAARAGGLVAANTLLGNRLTMAELLPLAVALEGHGDNIIPALFGGLQVVAEDEGRHVHVKITPPGDLRLALLIPEFSMPTEESRKLIPTNLTRNQAVHNIGRAAMIVAALTQGRYDALVTAVEDILHQPARGTLFPAMFPIFEGARAAGAHGVYLSGGGSTIAAFADPATAEHVANTMREVAAAHGAESVTRVVAMSNTGTEVIDR